MASTNLPPVVKAPTAQRALGRVDITDPLAPLIDAVEEALVHHVMRVPALDGGAAWRVGNVQATVSGGERSRRGQSLAELRAALKHVVAEALTTSLGARTAQGRQLRLSLANRLLSIEIGQSPSATSTKAPLAAAGDDADPLLKSADVAARLGMSRPYVAMLCDSGKLGEVTMTEGGHRRVRQSSVEAYRASQRLANAERETPREAAAAAGMYAVGDEAFVKAARRATRVPEKRAASKSAHRRQTG